MKKLEGHNVRIESLGPPEADWAKFYSKKITKEDMVANIEHHRSFIDMICDLAHKASGGGVPKLIEIGLGTATMSIYLSKRPYEVTGLDLDPRIVVKAIETNKALGGYAKFITMDAFDMPRYFREDSFDIAFSQGTMEHFDNEELERMLKAQLTVAKYVAFSVPSVNWPQEDFGNERKLAVEEWETMLKKSGFAVKHLSYYQTGDLHVAAVISKS